MSTSNRLDPKTLPTDNWKQWHRDALRMWKRTGLLTQLAFIVMMAGASAIGGHIVLANINMVLLVVPVMMGLGFGLIPVQMRVLSRARRGEDPSPVEDLVAGLSDTVSNPKWWLRGVLVALAWALGILAFIVLLSPSPDEQTDATRRAATALDLASMAMTYATIYLWALKPRGFLGMDYFLEVREGLSRDLAKNLELLAGGRNPVLIFMAASTLAMGVMMTLLLVRILAAGPTFAWLGLVIFPLITWHAAGVTLCAWHDIFDPDGGLAEKQKVSALEPAHTLPA